MALAHDAMQSAVCGVSKGIKRVIGSNERSWPCRHTRKVQASGWSRFYVGDTRAIQKAPPVQNSVGVFASPPTDIPTSAYIHLPFCKRKCRYCDFPVVALGQSVAVRNNVPPAMERYVDSLLAEIEATAILSGGDQTPALATVYFGGGTPSLVPPHLLDSLLSKLSKRFGIAPGAEITLEADPGTFNLSTLQDYKALGISRLSVGIQSFDDEILSLCGRSHTRKQAWEAVETIHQAGFASWSLDLMAGLPGLSPDLWRSTLTQAIRAGPEHIAVYDLQVSYCQGDGRCHVACFIFSL